MRVNSITTTIINGINSQISPHINGAKRLAKEFSTAKKICQFRTQSKPKESITNIQSTRKNDIRKTLNIQVKQIPLREDYTADRSTHQFPE